MLNSLADALEAAGTSVVELEANVVVEVEVLVDVMLLGVFDDDWLLVVLVTEDSTGIGTIFEYRMLFVATV